MMGDDFGCGQPADRRLGAAGGLVFDIDEGLRGKLFDELAEHRYLFSCEDRMEQRAGVAVFAFSKGSPMTRGHRCFYCRHCRSPQDAILRSQYFS